MSFWIADFMCCQGGAGKGYHDAGFTVVGIDIEPQPRYPFSFLQYDATELLSDVEHMRGHFDAIHVSPVCRRYSRTQKIRDNDHPDQIAQVRELCKATGLPYVIENVPGAPLENPIMLCGTMFGLPLYRHRLFECSFPVTEPLHGQHYLRQVKMGRKPGPDEIHQPVGHFSGVAEARVAMGMPWANQDGLREAVPPAYTRHIGEYLMAHLDATTKAAA